MVQIFGMGRYETETKPNKNWEFQNGGFLPNEARQNSNLLTFQAERIKFLR